jgi:hypothetical protein
MAGFTIDNEDLIRELGEIADQESMSIEEALSALFEQYRRTHSDAQPIDGEVRARKLRLAIYEQARRYWRKAGDATCATLTDAEMDEQFMMFDEEGIPRLKSEGVQEHPHSLRRPGQSAREAALDVGAGSCDRKPMITERPIGVQVVILSVVPDAEYEGKAYGYYVRVEDEHGAKWGLLDTDMQANPSLAGAFCFIRMLACPGTIENQSGREKKISIAEYAEVPVLFGEVLNISKRPLHRYEHKLSAVLDFVLDVGTGIFDCNTVHWFAHEAEYEKLDFKLGDFVICRPARVDLLNIDCSDLTG